jgi:uncharacterized protein YggT (Ycf19 family)
MIARIIWLVGAVVIVLLLLRFFFILFGVSPLNDFAGFVYDVTKPLVSPFFGLFNYSYISGRATVEIPCLVAIAVYTLIAAVLSWVVSPRRVA